MELSRCSSFGKASSTSMPPSDFLDKVHMKAQHQPGSNIGHSVVADVDVDLREIYFLIMHFLSSGPCQRTSVQFWKELLEYQLLPRRYHGWYSRNGEVTGDENDDGISFPLSYESVVQRYSHVEKDHLVKLLKQLILNVAPSRGIVGRTGPSAADVPTLLGIGSFSLLGCARNEVNVQVKPLPAHLRWPHMQAGQVHGIGLREIGGGFPKHHRAPSIRFACYAIAKPSTMVQKMQNIKKLRGHRDAVYCAIFDRSGRYVITGSDDRLVKIWSMETAFCLASCRGHEGDITDLAVNLNNALVASASNDFSIRVWRFPDGYPISVLRGHTGAVTAIAFSPRHNSVYQLLSSSDDGTCRIWDARASHLPPRIYLPRQTDVFAGRNSGLSTSNGPSSSNMPQNHQILCCAYNANGTVFVTGSSDTFARVWSACKSNVDDSQQPTHEIDILAGHENDVNYVQFSGCAVASRSLISDSPTDDKVPKFKNSWYSHDNIVTCSRDGSAIIWIPRSRRYQGKVGRWTRAYHLKVPPPPMPPQPRRGGPRQRFLPTPRGVNMIIWSLDNRFVLAAIMDCRICVWNAADGSLVHSLTGHSESTYVLDVHPFNPRIAMSAGYDGKTIIWDIWEGIPIRVYEIGRFKLVDGKFSPDGTSIVLSDDVGQIYLLNTGQGESQKDSKYDQFFLGDYRPFGTDAHGIAVDQETQLLAYRRNIQDSLCDSSMLPYPEPYQSNYQRRRLGALNLEWRPPSVKFAIGTDIGLGQEYQILPLADLDFVAEPLPEFVDAMFWEPENDMIVDTTDSEYNVTDEYSSEDEQGSLSNSSSDAESCGANNISEGSHKDGRRRSKRKKTKDDEWTFSSGRRVKKRNLNEHEGTSSRSKRTKRSRNGGNTLKRHSNHLTTSRPQRVSARNGRNFFSRSTGTFRNEKVDDLSEDDSSESESWLEGSCIQEENPVGKQQLPRGDQSSLAETMNVVPPTTHPELRRKLVLKFSVPKKSMDTENSASQTNIKTNSTSSRLEAESSRPVNKECSENPNTTREKEELDKTENHFEASTGTNGLNSRPRPTIIRIKPMVKTNSDVNVSTSGGGDLTIPNIRPELGVCSEMNMEMDDVSQRKRTLKFKINRHADDKMVQDTLNARSHDDERESEAATDAMRRTRSLKLKASSRETNDTFKNHKLRISVGTLRSAEKSSTRHVNSIPTFGDGFFNNNDGCASGSRSNIQPGKPNWLLLTEQEEGCRYIPQLGDEVVYLRQGHKEYIELYHSLERGPWMLYGQHIKDVEVCSVDDVEYATFAGSGESCVRLELSFIDSFSNVHGQRFKLTLPDLIDFPDFLVERTRYNASIEKSWSPGDTCSVWWRDVTGGGNWWEGQICSIVDKSVDFPGSPWERFRVQYEEDNVEYHRHSPWELHDKDSHWEQPGIDPERKMRMLYLLAKLEQSARGNEDKYGIMKLKQLSERKDFINMFPVPLTLEIIELRLKNNYYRSFDAMKHDIMVMLSNVEKYFAKNAAMLTKMARLTDWFDRKLS